MLPVRLILLAFVALALGCAEEPASESAASDALDTPMIATDTVRTDWARFFEAQQALGTVVVYDAATAQTQRYNPDRADERFAPASSFKVYNSLVALETGVVPNVDTVYTWDGVERGGAWDQDHSLRMAMRNSTVWLFQELAREIGQEQYEATFAREPYGNNAIGEAVDGFWLGEPLAISANEQVAYLDRLRQGTLAFRPEVQADVREIMTLEATDTHTLYGKTGWTWTRDDRSDEIGWLVGWIERDGAAHVYALNVTPNGPDFDMREARLSILHAVLDDLGLRPLDLLPEG